MNTGREDEDRPAGYVELLLINPTFRRLFAARVVSLLGDWFNTLAVLALLRSIGGDDARAFGWILILKTAPQVLVTPLAGSLVDRLPRKGLMVAGDLILAGLVVTLFTLEAAPAALQVWGLYGVIVTMTLFRAVAEPARSAVLPDVVRKQDLGTANAMGSAAWSLMFTIGTALGGVVTATLGWKVALGIDVVTYLVSAGLVITLAIPEVPSDRKGSDRSFLAGMRYLAARPRVWTLSVCKMGWSLAGGITLVLTILGERVYSKSLSAFSGLGSPELLAVTLLYMARGVGTGLGPILSRHLCGVDPVKIERIIGVSYFWAAGCYIVMGQIGSLGLTALLLVLAHLGGATVWVFSTVRLQALLPTEVRGRVFAAEQGCFTLSMGTSTYLFSTAIDLEWVGLPQVASVLGLILLVPASLWWIRGRTLGYGTSSPGA